MATTTQSVSLPVTAEDLEAVNNALAFALERIEEVSFALNDVDPNSRSVPLSRKWMIEGFAEDALTDAETILKFALAIRARVRGGYSQHEADLMEAAGGTFELPDPT